MLCTKYSQHIHMNILLTEMGGNEFVISKIAEFHFLTEHLWDEGELVSVRLCCSSVAGCSFWMFQVIEFEFHFQSSIE